MLWVYLYSISIDRILDVFSPCVPCVRTYARSILYAQTICSQNRSADLNVCFHFGFRTGTLVFQLANRLSSYFMHMTRQVSRRHYSSASNRKTGAHFVRAISFNRCLWRANWIFGRILWSSATETYQTISYRHWHCRCKAWKVPRQFTNDI